MVQHVTACAWSHDTRTCAMFHSGISIPQAECAEQVEQSLEAELARWPAEEKQRDNRPQVPTQLQAKPVSFLAF